MKIAIEISARHCHISKKDLDIIYGKNYKLTPIKKLSQGGQYACKETISVKAGNKKIDGIRILGPERKNTQVELSMTDSYELKVKPPIAECTSPNKANGCVTADIIGPKGSIKRCAIIIAHRHLHTDPKTAKKYGLKNKQLISARIGNKRSITLHNILVRIDPSFKSRIHLDTDEANAGGVKSNDKGELIIK